jgi:hypothetical protein
MIEIESGIPIPPRDSKRKGKTIYPLVDMEIGQSFFVPCKPGKTAAQTRNNMVGSIHQCTKKTGARFVTRVVEGGVRVWRFK